MWTVRIDETAMDSSVLGGLDRVLTEVERGGIEHLVLRFGDRSGDFPTWPAGASRPDMRYHARWDETLARIARLSAKTIAAFDGRVGSAAVQVGLVTDLRLASAAARLCLPGGEFAGMAAYRMTKFVGLGVARRLLLLGGDLPADEAFRLGLVDVVEASVDAAVEATVKALRPVSPEAARLTRRLLDDSYALEPAAATELAKAARFQVGMPTKE